MMKNERTISRRREKKILKIHRILNWSEDPRLVYRLRCLERAEANDIHRRFFKNMPVDLTKVDEDLRKAKELLAKYRKSGS